MPVFFWCSKNGCIQPKNSPSKWTSDRVLFIANKIGFHILPEVVMHLILILFRTQLLGRKHFAEFYQLLKFIKFNRGHKFPGKTFQNIPQTADKPVRKTDFHRQSWSERAAQIFVFSERTLFTLYVWPGRIVDEQTRHAGITNCADRSESKPQMTREITHHGSRVDVWLGEKLAC